jgi:hypothetical protein
MLMAMYLVYYYCVGMDGTNASLLRQVSSINRTGLLGCLFHLSQLYQLHSSVDVLCSVVINGG